MAYKQSAPRALLLHYYEYDIPLTPHLDAWRGGLLSLANSEYHAP